MPISVKEGDWLESLGAPSENGWNPRGKVNLVVVVVCLNFFRLNYYYLCSLSDEPVEKNIFSGNSVFFHGSKFFSSFNPEAESVAWKQKRRRKNVRTGFLLLLGQNKLEEQQLQTYVLLFFQFWQASEVVVGADSVETTTSWRELEKTGGSRSYLKLGSQVFGEDTGFLKSRKLG